MLKPKKYFRLFYACALIFLMSSMMFAWFSVPFCEADGAGNLNLHSENPLVPVHMHGPPLVPVHMHCLFGIIPIVPPQLSTPWHELYPQFCENWVLTSVEDNGNGILDTCDQIDMTNAAGETRWYHVDRVTYTMNVSGEYGWRYIEFKGAYNPFSEVFPYPPIGTLWHEVYPTYSNVYKITYWTDSNTNGILDYCDWIELNYEMWVHVEEMATDLILNEKIMDPKGIWWHELYPEFCLEWVLTSWEDNGDRRLSPSDQIDMTQREGSIVKWYHVDRVTFTLLVSNMSNPEDTMYIELKDWPFENLYYVKTNPLDTKWHEVYPDYCNVYLLTYWEDNCNGVLSWCDIIGLYDPQALTHSMWHVEELSIDIILNEKIMDPTCTYWNELHPDFGNRYHIIDWTDNGDKMLSPSDYVYLNPGPIQPVHVETVTLTLLVSNLTNPAETMYIEYMGGFEEIYRIKTAPGGYWYEVYPDYYIEYQLMSWDDNCNGVLSYCDTIQLLNLHTSQMSFWHVEEVAIDITVKLPVHDVSVTSVTPLFASVFQGWPCPITVVVSNDGDFTETFDVDVKYDGSHVTTSPQTVYSLPAKTSKMLTFCWVTTGVPVNTYTISAYAHPVPGELPADQIDNTFNDGLVTILAPPPFYWKPGFCDYAPSGMPDFSQKQWGTYNWTDNTGAWSHCGPTAVANSLWWLDSEFEPAQPPLSPPGVSDGFRLVSSYATMPPFWDDHDPLNVPPLIEHLAYLMDTEGPAGFGVRTGLAHYGTNVRDMEAGLAHYLSWTTVNPLGDVNGDAVVNQTDVNIVTAAMNSQPGMANWTMAADIYPVTLGWPTWARNADNKVNASDLALVNANLGSPPGFFYERTVAKPEFEYIEAEVEKCEDVVLLLGYWYFNPLNPPGYEWTREGGHYVTVAGVNSTQMKIALSDPCYDAFEFGFIPEGRVPILHGHPIPEPPYRTHNDAAYVSHDIYSVALVSQFGVPPNLPCPGGNWTLVNYVGWRPTPPHFTVIEYAVVTSPLGVHDVAITDMKPVCTPPYNVNKTVVCQGYSIGFNVTVKNKGDFTESFNVVLKANATVIGSNPVNSLLPGTTTNVIFTWNTNTSTLRGSYNMSAVADQVAGETNITDNTFYYPRRIYVSYVGDLTGGTSDIWEFVPDKIVDGSDIIVVDRCFGSWPGAPPPMIWHPNCDITSNKAIDGEDEIIVTARFGESAP